jgi:hypothetical protein
VGDNFVKSNVIARLLQAKVDHASKGESARTAIDEANFMGDKLVEVAQRLAARLGPQVLVQPWSNVNRTWFAATRIEKRMMFLILALIVATPAPAQEPTHYTYVSFWAVPRAQWTEFEKGEAETNAILERLVADGTLVAWGNAYSLVHTEDGYTHSDWFVSTTQAGILKTLEALHAGSTSSAFVNTVKHQDLMLHSIAHGGKTAHTTSGYVRVAFWQVKPGQGERFQELFKKYVQPGLDAGVADGSVLMYNFDAQQVHTDAPGAYNLAVIYADGDGLDKSAAALAARSKENPAAAEAFTAMIRNEAHRDTLGRVLNFQHK